MKSTYSYPVGQYKQCRKCGAVWSVRMFAKRPDTKDGLQHYCKACRTYYYRQQRAARKATPA